MSEPSTVFVDYPGVTPREQDNPLCLGFCRAQGRFGGASCIRRDLSSLRRAVELGYTKAKRPAAYPPGWLDRGVQVCHCGLVLLTLTEPVDEQEAVEETPERGQALDREAVIARLTALRQEVETSDLAQERFTPPFALVLSDVCHALGLTRREHDQVLGPEAAAYVARIHKRRWWPSRERPLQHLARLLPKRRQAARRP
jgi:hypothetical protein